MVLKTPFKEKYGRQVSKEICDWAGNIELSVRQLVELAESFYSYKERNDEKKTRIREMEAKIMLMDEV